jgi:hypothetical protein
VTTEVYAIPAQVDPLDVASDSIVVSDRASVAGTGYRSIASIVAAVIAAHALVTGSGTTGKVATWSGAGTITAIADQVAGTLYTAPAPGNPDGAPVWRTLISADIPTTLTGARTFDSIATTDITASGLVTTASSLRSTGSGTVAIANATYLDYVAGSTGRLVVYGPDTVTPGAFQLVGLSSDASAGDIRLTVSSAGIVTVTSTTASTSKTTGALVVSGGLGVNASIFADLVTIGDGSSCIGSFTWEPSAVLFGSFSNVGLRLYSNSVVAVDINTSQQATFSGLVITPAAAAGASGYASIRLPHGAAPTTNLTDGDVWTTTAGLFARINGATVAFGSASPGGSTTQMQYNNAGAFGGIASFTYDSTENQIKFLRGSTSSVVSALQLTQTQTATSSSRPLFNLTATCTPGSASSAIYTAIDATAQTGSSASTISGQVIALNVNALNLNSSSLADLRGISLLARSGGSGIATTALYGVRIITQVDASGSATDGYGLYVGSNYSGTVTNKWGVYQATAGDSNYFAGNTGVGIAPSSSTFLNLAAGTTAKSSLRIPNGGAPTSPVDGDMWYDGTNVNFRVGGTTKTFTLL